MISGTSMAIDELTQMEDKELAREILSAMLIEAGDFMTLHERKKIVEFIMIPKGTVTLGELMKSCVLKKEAPLSDEDRLRIFFNEQREKEAYEKIKK